VRAADTDDEVAATWIAVDLLRRMYQAPDRDTAHRRLVASYEWAVAVDVAEITRLASTIDTWQDEVLAFFATRASNAATESAPAASHPRKLTPGPVNRSGLPQHGELRGPDQASRRPAT
jgi:hypothetical protein